ncbi:hypothetical protein EYF80_060178 [Liparis tanakae]|uniref:Uncharacterized protein n=1 Tax=Liparis tanakae TaxID=230148 RepID=A0A4Z2ELE7_9TELE|nr:hypothetical protein EYF80_060178 [Liparis tanakae]
MSKLLLDTHSLKTVLLDLPSVGSQLNTTRPSLSSLSTESTRGFLFHDSVLRNETIVSPRTNAPPVPCRAGSPVVCLALEEALLVMELQNAFDWSALAGGPFGRSAVHMGPREERRGEEEPPRPRRPPGGASSATEAP